EPRMNDYRAEGIAGDCLERRDVSCLGGCGDLLKNHDGWQRNRGSHARQRDGQARGGKKAGLSGRDAETRPGLRYLWGGLVLRIFDNLERLRVDQRRRQWSTAPGNVGPSVLDGGSSQ